jgi:hypothetical protein
MNLSEIVKKLRHGDIDLPTLTRVPDDHVLDDGYRTEPFKAGRDYFSVRVNSMSLQYGRDWLTTWQPMLVSQTEFRYGDQAVSVPFTVGPSLLKQQVSADIPLTMVFRGTDVAGLHPYAGGTVSVAVLLYRVQHDDYVKRVLGVVEKLAQAFDYSLLLSPYLKVADAVVDGINAVLGHKDTEPVVGYRVEFNPNVGNDFGPGYFALLTGEQPTSNSLWVRDDVLLTGPDAATCVPVPKDAVLFSITSTSKRNDIDSLPWFQPLWQRVHRAANTPNDDGKTAAKAHLGVLLEHLMESPDVAPEQVWEIYGMYEAMAHKVHDLALGRKNWGPDDLATSEDDLQRDFLQILTGGWHGER